MIKSKKIISNDRAFTIVELLVVIVVIGILAAITIVSYSGISNKAISASLQSDLDGVSKQLRMYNVEYGYYPSALDGSNCPSTPTPDRKYCLKFSSDTTFTYSGSNKSFRVTATKSGQTYRISDDSTPISGAGDVLTALSAPTIAAESAPEDIAISADGTSVYATNQVSGTISMYSRDVSTGALATLSPSRINTGATTQSIVVANDGASVYTIGSPNSIYMYSRNPLTGILTALGTPTIGTGTGSSPIDLVISSDGKSVYTANLASNTISMYSRNASTGLLTALATPTIATGTGPYSITISPDGTSLYAVTSSNSVYMYSRNTSTGLLTALGTPSVTTATGPRYITTSPDGKFIYVASDGGAGSILIISMYSRNASTGLLTDNGALNTNIYTYTDGIAISYDGTSVYIPSHRTGTVLMYSRNTSTGLLTALGTPTITAGTGPSSITMSPDGMSVYVVNSASNNISMYKR